MTELAANHCSSQFLWLLKKRPGPRHLSRGMSIEGRGNYDFSGVSWMYPYQRTPMGNPYISPI